jgi:hypothetical protein
MAGAVPNTGWLERSLVLTGPLSTDNTTGGVAGSSVPESTRHAAELR